MKKGEQIVIELTPDFVFKWREKKGEAKSVTFHIHLFSY